ncbi:MAG: ribosome biogenesis GTPase Der [Lysobacterales bacterium CG02_land_8_20_14_3_00_62_12]|nr:MAG: ribosome biogenesis GTPase Der [Xanthomonadales bacterium CG02_land_8_20_14_3_00_62_12]
MLPVVALVGRPNVGKSTLFNVLTRSRDALVADEPGVTRDRHYGTCRLGSSAFLVIDTGGFTDAKELLAEATVRQSLAAVDECQVAVFMVDAKDGLLAADRVILEQLRRFGRPVILAVNKTDGRDVEQALSDFSEIGLRSVLAISSAHKRGIDGLLGSILRELPETSAEDAIALQMQGTKVAIIGRPNVGKSTLVNRLLGEERMIESAIPGTTRDAIYVSIERNGVPYVLVDTAGVRRKSKVEEVIEKFSIIKTLQALEDAQVAVLMIDAQEGVTDQDASVLGLALQAGRALVVAVNKWDDLSPYQRERCVSELDRKLVFVPWAERLFISAKHGSGLGDLIAAVDRAAASAAANFGASEVTKALELAVASNNPPMVSGHAPKLRYAHFGGNYPPRIVIHGNRLDSLPQSYVRYLENFFRKHFRLSGTPVVLDLRRGENPFAGKKNVLTEKQLQSRKRLLKHVKKR